MRDAREPARARIARRMRISACPAPHRNVMSLRNDRYPRLTSETTREGENLLINTRARAACIVERGRAQARKRVPIFRRCSRLSSTASSILAIACDRIVPRSRYPIRIPRPFLPASSLPPSATSTIRFRREDHVNTSAIIDGRDTSKLECRC